MPTPAELAKAFEALEAATAKRPALGMAERAAGRFVSSGEGLQFAGEEAASTYNTAKAAGQKGLEFIRRRGGQTAMDALKAYRASPKAVNDAVKVAKAGAEVGAKGGSWLARQVQLRGKGVGLGTVWRAGVPAAAGAAALGYSLNHFAQESVDDAHSDSIKLLNKYGLKVDRGNEESGPDVGGLGDAAGWFTGTGDNLLRRAASLEGDPNWTHPVSDMNTLKVTTPDGGEISGGSSTEDAMKSERDLFIASGRMDNEWRKQPHLELLPKSDWPKPGEKAKPFLPPVFVPPWARKKK